MIVDIFIVLCYPIVFIYGYRLLEREYRTEGEVDFLSIIVYLMCSIIAPVIVLAGIIGISLTWFYVIASHLKATKRGIVWYKED